MKKKMKSRKSCEETKRLKLPPFSKEKMKVRKIRFRVVTQRRLVDLVFFF